MSPATRMPHNVLVSFLGAYNEVVYGFARRGGVFDCFTSGSPTCVRVIGERHPLVRVASVVDTWESYLIDEMVPA